MEPALLALTVTAAGLCTVFGLERRSGLREVVGIERGGRD